MVLLENLIMAAVFHQQLHEVVLPTAQPDGPVAVFSAEDHGVFLLYIVDDTVGADIAFAGPFQDVFQLLVPTDAKADINS